MTCHWCCLHKRRPLLVNVKAHGSAPHATLGLKAKSSHIPHQDQHISGAFSGLRPICPPLPLPFSSDPQSLLPSVSDRAKNTQSRRPATEHRILSLPKPCPAQAPIIKNGCHPNTNALLSRPTIGLIITLPRRQLLHLFLEPPRITILSNSPTLNRLKPYTAGLAIALLPGSPPLASDVHNQSIVNSTHQQHPFIRPTLLIPRELILSEPRHSTQSLLLTNPPAWIPPIPIFQHRHWIMHPQALQISVILLVIANGSSMSVRNHLKSQRNL
jgi:hypothetical protein